MTDPTGATEPASRSSTSATPAEGAGAEPDWTVQVTDLIVDSVDKVRTRTTGPILEISKGAVHAVVAILLAVPVFTFGIVGVVRLLDWAIPGDVWIVYGGLGIIFTLVGVVLWGQRSPRRR